MGHPLTLVRMASIKNSINTKCWRGCEENGTLLHCWWECKLEYSLWTAGGKFLFFFFFNEVLHGGRRPGTAGSIERGAGLLLRLTGETAPPSRAPRVAGPTTVPATGAPGWRTTVARVWKVGVVFGALNAALGFWPVRSLAIPAVRGTCLT